ncbi:hypothetical protein IV203_021836 [Nitzschia inconspicua]|uniref:Uncharacterized protein n=1 Tax=Nitzschia inconspicua TaxID=303405 RepID=A0A9K3K5V7_9STRA|nr:hypothetical protein IV203_033458 [Nitzschia inconspicua]KAG7343828.1 hypothetical protein IV203_021836 [Nitzschia inconspicua]
MRRVGGECLQVSRNFRFDDLPESWKDTTITATLACECVSRIPLGRTSPDIDDKDDIVVDYKGWRDLPYLGDQVICVDKSSRTLDNRTSQDTLLGLDELEGVKCFTANDEEIGHVPNRTPKTTACTCTGYKISEINNDGAPDWDELAWMGQENGEKWSPPW